MKQFYEVFPQFSPEGHLSALADLLQVERVTVADDYSSLNIYVECPRLVQSSVFREMEQGVARQLFPGKNLTANIKEHFVLSGSFTP